MDHPGSSPTWNLISLPVNRLFLPLFGLALVALILWLPTQVNGARLKAERQLLEAGYSQVDVSGWNIFACSEDDVFRIGFKALGPTGKPVSGTVCSGFLKGATIRLD